MRTAIPILYSFRRCPYATRARLALQASGIDVELREIELKAKPAAMLAASAKATVPVLVLADRVLEQSLDIMLWALRQHDPLGWLPAGPQALRDAMDLVTENDGAFKQRLDRYKYPHRFGLPDGLAHREEAADFLKMLDARLQAASYLAGANQGLPDAALAPFVRQFAHTDPVWFANQGWDALAQWLQTFESSSAFAQVMQKTVPWKDGDVPHITCFAAP